MISYQLLIEEFSKRTRKCDFCEIEKTWFKVLEILQCVTGDLRVGFLRNFVHTISTSNAIQQSTFFHKCYRNKLKITFHTFYLILTPTSVARDG